MSSFQDLDETRSQYPWGPEEEAKKSFAQSAQNYKTERACSADCEKLLQASFLGLL